MNIFLKIESGHAKRGRNIEKHGLDFTAIDGFLWDIALTREDARLDYDEARYVLISLIGGRHYVAVWTMRGNTRRLISLRKSNGREVNLYARTKIVY